MEATADGERERRREKGGGERKISSREETKNEREIKTEGLF